MTKPKVKFVILLIDGTYVNKLANTGAPFPGIGTTAIFERAERFDSVQDVQRVVNYILLNCRESITLIPVEE